MKRKLTAILAALTLLTSAMPVQAAETVNNFGDPYDYQPIPELTVRGDSDESGKFGLTDAIMLQEFLMNMNSVSNWVNADMNRDGVLNIFDLVLMKNKLFDAVPKYTAEEMTKNLASQPVKVRSADDAFVQSQTAFALSLLQRTAKEGKNTLVSPYSVMQALAMTANGAQGQTLAEMEQVLAGGGSIDTLNEYLAEQRTQHDATGKLLTANSVWYNNDAERIQVKDAFLRNVKDYYDASAFAAPFDDTTVNDINKWVRIHTDDMIPKLVDRLNPDIVMCLIDAVTFDAQWEHTFETDYTYDAKFTSAEGDTQTVSMMHDEEYYYLTDDHATGFLKYYKGGQYAFAALLPEEGMTTSEYLAALDADSLHKLLSTPSHDRVNIGLPKFSLDYSIELSDTLIEMGMPDAFEPDFADFSAMADTASGALFIDSVIHKTHIDMDEDGTRAAAVTAVMMSDATAVMDPPKVVVLDRPFVYAIIDTENQLPIFFGTVETLSE